MTIWDNLDFLRLKLTACEFCGTTEDVSFEADPYQSDVNNDDTPHWICGHCSHEHAMDIPLGEVVTVLTGLEANAAAEAAGARPGEFTTVPVAELLALNTPEGEL